MGISKQRREDQKRFLQNLQFQPNWFDANKIPYRYRKGDTRQVQQYVRMIQQKLKALNDADAVDE